MVKGAPGAMDAFAKTPLLSVAAMAVVLPASAHHSRAIYDLDRNVTLDGVVTEFEWANPHVYLYVEAPNDAGELVVWTIENGSTTAMGRRGWSPAAFRSGASAITRSATGRPCTRCSSMIRSRFSGVQSRYQVPSG